MSRAKEMLEIQKGRKYLVTGASGFIGKRICQKLSDLGAEVFGASRTPIEVNKKVYRHVQADLSVAEEADHLFRTVQPEFVLHLAGCTIAKREIVWVRETFSANLATTVNILVAAHNYSVSKTVLAGSLEEPDRNESYPVPVSPYAASKWCASAYARTMHVLYGMNVAVARIFMVYGPGQTELQKLIPYVCLSAINSKSPQLMSGNRLVDWIYVDDAVEGLIKMTHRGPVDGSYVDLGSGQLVTTGDVAKMICQIAGTGVHPTLGALPDRPMEQVRKADRKTTEFLLNWSTRTDLLEGLEYTYAWYKDIIHQADSVAIKPP